MKLSQNEVLKRINGHPDCASEFILCNQDVDDEDHHWMVAEVNRSFKLWKVPLLVKRVEFLPQLAWFVEETS